jgi:hypothetical protein
MSLLIFKILPPSATFHGVDYNEKKCKKEKATVLHHEGFGFLMDGGGRIDRKQSKRYLESHSSSNTRIRNKQFHAIMSCKGKSISFERLKSYGLEIVHRLGYAGNPILVYGHNDTDNYHVHIISSRVDIEGKKIAHHFERKRANEILTDIIGIDKGKVFNQDIDSCLAYRFETVSQFKLLLEQRGYAVKNNGEDLVLFKFGSRSGVVPAAAINSCIFTVDPGNPAIKKIRALIGKYKKLYAVSALKETPKYTTAPEKFKTALTDFLHQRFGLQFVFFRNKNHESPYGYVVIDHKNKHCYKGSSILSLKSLLADKIYESYQKELQPTEPKSSEQPATQATIEFPDTQKQIESIPHLDSPLQQIIFDTEKAVEEELGQAGANSRKKRRSRFL